MSVMTLAGWHPDPEELPEGYKRRAFEGVMGVFSARAASSIGDYDIPTKLPVYDQGMWGSCVANALTGVMNIVLELQGDKTTMLSRMFLYRLCRLAMHTEGQDSGTYPYLAAERVGKIGICTEATFPYVTANMYGGIPPECYPEASDNKATAWFDIQGTGRDRLDQLDVAIRSNHPVMFGTTVDSSIQNYKAGDVLSIPTGNIGGHALAIVGIRYINGKRCWRIRNSWGEAYGDDGHLLIDDDYMGWTGTRDLHMLTRMDRLLF